MTYCLLTGATNPGERTDPVAKIYCAPCFETCTGAEPAAAPGICRCCGKPIAPVALDPYAHAKPYTASDAAFDRGFERRTVGE